MAVMLGLAVALTYGSGDFFGGLASRRTGTVSVVATSQFVGLLLLIGLSVAIAGAGTTADDLVRGAVAGIVGLCGLLLLYRGLAVGRMSLVAPLTAVTAAILPLAWGLASGERPSALAFVGVATALSAVVLVASQGDASSERHHLGEVALALGAGAAFGGVFVLLGSLESDAGLWPLVAARLASLTVLGAVLLAWRRPIAVSSGTGGLIVLTGLLDGGANAIYVYAAREGLLSLVGVLSSLYPAATVLLARVVLGERMRRRQAAGIGLALLGVTLIATG